MRTNSSGPVPVERTDGLHVGHEEQGEGTVGEDVGIVAGEDGGRIFRGIGHADEGRGLVQGLTVLLAQGGETAVAHGGPGLAVITDQLGHQGAVFGQQGQAGVLLHDAHALLWWPLRPEAKPMSCRQQAMRRR